jgi:hypothetical protein
MKTRPSDLIWIDDEAGLRIVGVTPGSPADRVGLEAGDVITRVHNYPLVGIMKDCLREWLHGICRAHVRDLRTGRTNVLNVHFGE